MPAKRITSAPKIDKQEFWMLAKSSAAGVIRQVSRMCPGSVYGFLWATFETGKRKARICLGSVGVSDPRQAIQVASSYDVCLSHIDFVAD